MTGLLGTYLKLSTACRTLSNRENDFDGESDGDLWSQVSTHNGAAFAELFERHSKSVYNHCFRLTGSWSAAEDLTSVVFLQAWRRRDQVRIHGDSILPWLLAVANNATRNSERSLRRHRLLLAKLPRSGSSSEFEDGIGDRMDDERRMQLILILVNRLKARERETLRSVTGPTSVTPRQRQR